MRLPWRRDPDALPPAAEKAIGRRLKQALDKAMADAGIPPDDGEQDSESDQETGTT